MLGRRSALVVVLVALVALVSSLPGAPEASADELYVISGIVADGSGRGRPGVYVTDGDRTIVTDSSATFRFESSVPGVRVVTAWIPGGASKAEFVFLTTPGERVVNFSFPHEVSTWGVPILEPISTAGGPVEHVLHILTDAPYPGSPGEAGRSCVSVVDSRTGDADWATFAGTSSTGNRHEWESTFSLPASTPEGTYELDARVIDCAGGAKLTEPDDGVRPYRVDNTPPEVSDPAPTGWVAQSTVVSARIVDAFTPMTPDIDSGCYRVSLFVDGERYQWPCFERADAERLEAAVNGLTHGPHLMEIRAGDDAGNSSERVPFEVTVDAFAPALSDPTPTGVVGDRSPTISVAVDEPDSGVEPSALVMRLSNGVVTSEVEAAYDPESGRITYEVPDEIAGPGLGAFPLLDGTYDVSVEVADRVGNVGTATWSFEVRALPAV